MLNKFVDYKSVNFPNLSFQNTPVFTADGMVMLNGVNIANKSSNESRISLRVKRTVDGADQFIYLVYNYLIIPNISYNLVGINNLNIFLEEGDVLYCSSSDFDDYFDLNISYTKLKE